MLTGPLVSFLLKRYKKFFILTLWFVAIRTHVLHTMIKIPMVLVVRVNLGFILSFLKELFILKGWFYMFSGNNMENVLFLVILLSDLPLTPIYGHFTPWILPLGAFRSQIEIKRAMVLSQLIYIALMLNVDSIV